MLVAFVALSGCGGVQQPLGDVSRDDDSSQQGETLSLTQDTREHDAHAPDDAPVAVDAADDAQASRDARVELDAAVRDTSVELDAARYDAGLSEDAPRDAAAPLDAGRTDASPVDGGTTTDARRDSSSGGCVSGAVGARAVRVRWAGAGGTSSSTAYVQYEANELPDTSVSRVTANARSVGYRPVFTDVFLGEGGLELSNTGFVDVELSTVGLATINRVTLAIYGRSFNTTASGSFRWQSFDGAGETPPNVVANSAPYRWYAADVTDAFSPANAGVRFRIYPGPSSGALIVNRIELCFDAR